MQLYRSKRFCFSFSQRHQTQLVCLVRFVSCPRTVVWAQARRVYLSGTWAYRFHVERACKWDRNSSRGVTMIIPSRSLPTIQPIYPYYSIYRTRFRKNSIRIFHSRCFYGCSSHVSLSRRLQSNFGFDELRISNRYRSLLKLFWWSSRVRIKIDALTKLRPCNCSLIQRDIYTCNTYTCPVRYEFLQYTDASYSLLLYTTYIVLPFQRLRLSND